jgi:methionyl-tRNA synthetase
MPKSFYLTTTLPYVNAPLHMGHALELVRADAIARYKKLAGYDVYFNTGTDEHGMKIYKKAKEKNIEIQKFVDQGFEIFKEQLKMFGISEDVHFIRTTSPHHEKAAQKFWNRVSKNGYIYKKNYEAKYCIGCESEKSNSELNEKGECEIHPGQSLEIIKEENYFFKYSAFQDKLLDFYEKNENFIVPDFRFHEIKNFVKSGLQDFSISRLKEKMPWGIEVPNDKDHVMYVWFDALVNYISTLGWPENTTPSAFGISLLAGSEESLFEKYWINGNPTQYCGKDNTRFQGAMWQAMLMAAFGDDKHCSHQIVVNGFITAEGGVRMSKTIGNVVDPRDIVKEYGTDALRYFLLREVSSFEDSPFTIERFKDAYNSGLANGLGNLVSRIMTLSEKYLDKCPEIPEKSDFTAYFKIYEEFDIKKAMDYIWERIQNLDKKIQETEPFKIIKLDEEKGKIMIKELILELYIIARMLNPVMPETNIKIKQIIKENKKPKRPLFLRRD